MPFYRDAATLYACLGRLFERVQRHEPQSIRRLYDARFTVRLRFSAPDAVLYFDGRCRPFRTTFDDTQARADLEVELAADTLHQVLLGNLAVTTAVGRRLIAVRGPVWKFYGLADIFEAGQQFYPQLLSEQKLR